jgi:lysophospholipase L1-like esterase
MGRGSRFFVSVIVATALFLVSAVGALAALPSSMAALGDSLTRGFGSAGVPGDNLAGSWSTGTDPAVNSHYQRLLALNPAISGHAANFAVNGSKMAGTFAQAASAVSQGPQYVTIFSGTNDVCTNTVAQMTSPATFQAQLTATLTRVTTGLPGVQILVVSIPNWYALWQTFHTDPAALAAWATFANRCPVLLGPAATDADRQAVAQRIVELNSAAAGACAASPTCNYDKGAAYNLTFTRGDLAFDFFHLSLAGQGRLAAVTWASGPFAPPSVAERLESLASFVTGIGPGKSLLAKVQSIAEKVADGDEGACGLLGALAHEVRAQTGKKLTQAQADHILSEAAAISAGVGCR